MPSSTVSKLSGLTSTNFRSLSFGKRLLGLASEIAHHPHDKWQFLDFDCPTDLHVVSNLNPRRTNPIQFMLRTFSCHRNSEWRRCPLKAQTPPGI